MTRRSDKGINDLPDLYRRALEATDTGVIITDPTQDDNPIVYINPAIERMTGYRSAELIGKNARLLNSGDRDQPALDQLRRAIDQGREVQVILRNYRKDGSTFYNDLRISPVRDDTGRLTHHIGIQHDVTEARAIQAELREQRDFTTAVLETVEALVVLLDSQARIQYLNNACERATGYRVAELRGRQIWDVLLPPEQIGSVKAVFRTLVGGDFPLRHENDWIAKDGRRLSVIWSNTCMANPDGTVKYVVGTGLDVTELREREAASRQAHKMEAIGELTGGIAHDFNNLLTVILGNLEVLQDQANLDERLALKLSDAREAAELGAKLTKSLLAFGRRQQLRPEVTDLNALVADTGDMLRRTLGEKIRVSTMLAPDPPMAFVDQTQLRSALLNLAINARDAMPDGGDLVMSTAVLNGADAAKTDPEAEPAKGYVSICVTDSGCGMTPDIVKRSTEPFFTTKTSGAGTGLGLSMVHGFSKQSGGYLRVQSTLGKGTAVEIILPRRRDGPAMETDRACAITPVGDGRTALLVEDDARVRRITSEQLEALGFEVWEAKDAKAALHILSGTDQPTVLVTDIVMPGEHDGFDLAENAKSMLPDLKILLVTGYSPTAPGHCDDKAAFPLLMKPYTLEQLAVAIKGLFA